MSTDAIRADHLEKALWLAGRSVLAMPALAAPKNAWRNRSVFFPR